MTAYVYTLRAADGSALYIGATRVIDVRLRLHRETQSWWGEVASIEVDAHADFMVAGRVERERIDAELPPYNARTSGNWDGRSEDDTRREARRKAHAEQLDCGQPRCRHCADRRKEALAEFLSPDLGQQAS